MCSPLLKRIETSLSYPEQVLLKKYTIWVRPALVVLPGLWPKQIPKGQSLGEKVERIMDIMCNVFKHKTRAIRRTEILEKSPSTS